MSNYPNFKPPVPSDVHAAAHNTTTYEVYLPFEMLGFRYAPGLLLRASFLANENDGGGRVRVMQWFEGITSGGDLSKFGFMILE